MRQEQQLTVDQTLSNALIRGATPAEWNDVFCMLALRQEAAMQRQWKVLVEQDLHDA
jgi:hypothetical protein